LTNINLSSISPNKWHVNKTGFTVVYKVSVNGGWLLTERGWLTDGGFPNAAERLLGGLPLVLECFDLVGDVGVQVQSEQAGVLQTSWGC
jgi:hypothetical protein